MANPTAARGARQISACRRLGGRIALGQDEAPPPGMVVSGAPGRGGGWWRRTGRGSRSVGRGQGGTGARAGRWRWEGSREGSREGGGGRGGAGGCREVGRRG